MKRVLTIDKCQDCNIDNCKLRTMCGTIPDECPLDTLLEESKLQTTPSWDNAPEWANWLTYDKDGWYWWDAKPDLYEDVYLMHSNGIEMSSADHPVPEKVTREIYSRPQEVKE